MSRLFHPRDRSRLAAWVIVFLTLADTPGVDALSGDAWEACRDRVVAALEAAGQRDFGDPSAYTGATGSGALDRVIAQCGYRAERIDPALCNDIYEQVYLPCREDGFEGMSMAATSWILIFDPAGRFIERLRRICAQSAPLSRAAFGRLVCGK